MRLSNEPKDFPWEWEFEASQWPPLTLPHRIQVVTNISWGLTIDAVLDERSRFEFMQVIFCDFEVIDLDDPARGDYTAVPYT